MRKNYREVWILSMAMSALAMGCEAADEAGAESAGTETTFSAIIDGKPRVFDDVEARLALESGVHRLRITGKNDPVPEAVDDESTLELTIELDSKALEGLSAGAKVDIDGATSFLAPGDAPASYGDLLEDEDIVHQPGAGESPAVARVWVRNWCYCSRYGAQAHDLTGSITLDAIENGQLRGAIHLDLDGTIPFFGTGFDGGVKAILDITFDASAASAG